MDEQKKAVETVETAAPQPGVEPIQSQAPGIDYAAELATALEDKARAEAERDNYKKGLLKAKGKLPEEETDHGQDGDVDAIAERVAQKLMPALQASMAVETMDTILNEISSGPDERKYIMHIFKGLDSSMGTIRERLENAKLIANKKTILKTHKELQLALDNRSQISSTAMGSNSEGMTVKTSSLSPDQRADLKKKGWDDAKIERFEKNLKKASA